MTGDALKPTSLPEGAELEMRACPAVATNDGAASVRSCSDPHSRWCVVKTPTGTEAYRR